MLFSPTQARTIIGGFALPIFVAAFLTGCERRELGTTETQAPVLVNVNGNELTQREFDLYLPEDYEHVLTTGEKREYLERWIVTQLLYDEAMRRGLGVSPEVKARLDQYKKDLVADQLVQQVIQERAVVSEEEVRSYYEAHKEEYEKEFRVSQILLNTREDAEKVKSEIGKYSFTYLARKYSVDKHSGYGGDLGFLAKGNMIPGFEEALFSMKTGDVSDIIESEFGYHILRLTAVRDARMKVSFDEARSEIANILMLKKRTAVYDSLVTALRSKAVIDIVDRDIGFMEESGVDTIPVTQ